MTFTGAVLTGGRSARMGRDKAFVEVDGAPLVTRARDALAGAGAAEVLAIGGDGSRLGALGLRFVADRWPGEGPLGGIVTALEAAHDDTVVVLACDLLAVVPDAVLALLDALDAAPGAGAAVPVVQGRAAVHVAAWRRRALPVLGAAFAAGERAPRALLDAIDATTFPLPDDGWTRGANRPDDLPQTDT